MSELPQNSGSADGLIERFAAALAPEAPVQEQAAESSQTPEEETQELPQEAEQAEEAPEDEQPEEGLVDLTLEDGRTYKVPQELKNEFMHKSDYTRKTQDIAQREAAAAYTLQERDLTQRFTEWTKDETAKLEEIKGQIKQYKQYLPQIEDTAVFMRAQVQLSQLLDESKTLEDTLKSKREQFSKGLEQARNEAAKAAAQFISRNVKGWQPGNQVDNEAQSYANQLGIPADLMSEMTVRFPGFGVLAAQAAQFGKIQATTGKAVQKAQAAPPIVKTGAVTQSNTLKARAVKQARENVRKTGSVDALQQYLLVKGIK